MWTDFIDYVPLLRILGVTYTGSVSMDAKEKINRAAPYDATYLISHEHLLVYSIVFAHVKHLADVLAADFCSTKLCRRGKKDYFKPSLSLCFESPCPMSGP